MLFSIIMCGFCFPRIRLNPLSCQFLYHDGVPVIVSRFTSLNEDFVIGRYEVTKLFCSWLSFASAFSARGFRYFCSQAGVAISVFREVSEDTLFPWLRCYFRRMFRIRILRNVCWCRYFCGNQIICENPVTRRAYLVMDPSCHFTKIPAQVSLSQFRQFALILNLRTSLLPLSFWRLEMPLVSTILVMA